ncbi:MAG: thiamine diphosphokinase [Candidatus Liberibacter ctenarytainae]|uniref:Thiamine diphosphokinase n=1 Tax=Candidatus Liberibacter ctenarytainae TaxID=2020335 RepID=A0A937AK55_9HYPH|nr:thiamine diphosphokinase [Candidatus Liberibacter ctenarytainae]
MLSSSINHSTNFAVLLNGDLHVTDRVVQSLQYCRIIAANGGISHADRLGVVPEIWVGDFDSTSQQLLQKWSAIKRLYYSADKDMTDGEIAVNQVLQMGAKHIMLVGALSGQRFDCALHHITLAMSLKKKNINVTLTSGLEEAFMLTSGRHRFDLPNNSIFSLVALSDIDDLTIVGAHYPLSHFPLSMGSSRTISNVAKKELTIILGKGLAVLLSRPYDLQRFSSNECTHSQT